MIWPLVAPVVMLSAGGIGAQATPSCTERLLPVASRAAQAQRAITPRDLIELRDFGRIDDGPARPSFRISPDGTLAALTLRRADPSNDDYCVGVIVVDLRGNLAPRLLDVGGKIIPSLSDVHGIPAIPSGLPGEATPIWSPDGKWLIYLRRDGDVTQIWRVGLNGEPATQLTRLSTEPTSPAWTVDGTGIVFRTRTALDAGRARILREGRTGYHYDERFWSVAESYPHPPLPLPTEPNLLDLATGVVSRISEEAWTATTGNMRSNSSAGAQLVAAEANRMAWIEPGPPGQRSGAPQLRILLGGKQIPCRASICQSPIAGLWWDRDQLLVLRDGAAADGGRTALFRWRIGGAAEPRKVLETSDWMVGCELAGGGLVCASESATRPRTLVRIDPDTGSIFKLYDPNPQLSGIRMGRVERLRWTDRDGVSTYGDLVLPPSHRLGQKHPLIVVQYLSRGFLRGGIGDEYPIQLFAERGYAVLSFQMPAAAPATDASSDFNERQRIKVQNWAWRRRTFTALDAGIERALATGTIDPDTIGITGMSDGSSTVQFAIINSTRFKAAIVSTCCDDPSGVFVVGPSYAASAKAWGYPAAGDSGQAFWKPQSLALNADRIRTPLLMQLPDGEYRAAAEGFAALQSRKAPVEMYVFPDERHTKIHPAHRLAIYERNLAWFDFWLRGAEEPETASRDEISRWLAMRKAARSSPGSAQ